MKGPFKADRSGVKVQLDTPEREVLVQLLTQLDQLLDDGRPVSDDPLAAMVGMDPGFDSSDEAPQAPGDPAVARLLPDASRDDPEAASEFRRLTEFSLRNRKREGARSAAAALSRPAPVHLSSDEAVALLKALTDVRLVIAERLELKTDSDAEALHDRLWSGQEDPSWVAVASTYELLTYWQENLVGAVSHKR